MLDTIIIGCGPAGMSAGIYLKNANKNVIILEKDVPGGKILKSKKINNYLGFSDLEPSDIAYKMYEQVVKLNIPIKIEKVINIKKKNNEFIIFTDKSEYISKKILITCGRTEKKLNLLNEDILIGKGISYCAKCDGALYKNKNVLVVGADNNGAEDAIYLSDIAESVIYLNYSNHDVKFKKQNIKVINNEKIIKINTENDILDSVVLSDGSKYKIDGLFILNGYSSNIDFIDDLNIKNDDGKIVVDKNMKTNIKGIYAAGDVIKKDLYQIITAASDGAIAAVNIIKELN